MNDEESTVRAPKMSNPPEDFAERKAFNLAEIRAENKRLEMFLDEMIIEGEV